MRYILPALILAFCLSSQLNGQDVNDILAPSFSKEPGSKWLSVHIGAPQMSGDIGLNSGPLFSKNITGGIGIYRMLLKRLSCGILAQYSYITNSNPAIGSHDRSYSYKSNIFEFGIHTEYQIFELLKGKPASLDFCLGGTANYILSSSTTFDSSTGEEIEMNGDEETNHGLIVYPGLNIYYTTRSFRLGLGIERGYSNSDYLDNYYAGEYKDIIDRIRISFGYRIK